jgi:hypothetical protein
LEDGGSVDLEHLFSERWSGGISLLGSESFLRKEGHFRRERGLSPWVLFQEHERTATIVRPSWSEFDYFLDSPAPLDRDGDVARLDLSQPIRLGGSWSDDWTLIPRTAVYRVRTEGSDHDHEGYQLGLDLNTPPIAGMQLNFSVSYDRANYAHRQFFADFREKRTDRILQGSVSGRYTIPGTPWAVVGTYRYVDHDSTISPYNFDKNDFFLGIEFLSFFDP